MTISPARSGPTTVLATVGFAVNSAAWMLISAVEPYLVQRYGLGRPARTAVLAAPLVAGALACVPVGALTDRYGARWTFPLVSLASSGALAALAVARTAPALILACCVLGVGGTAFTVGAALAARWDRSGRRGFRLSVFGAGIGGAAVGALVVRPLIGPLGVDTALLSMAAAPAGYAVVAAALVRDAPPRRADRSTVRDVAAMLRLSAMRYWVALHAIAAGSVLAMIAYLPTYLNRQYRLDWPAATVLMALPVVAAALSRPVGGWLAGRRDSVAILTGCFAGVGALGVVLAFQPPLPAAAAGFLGVAVGLGTVGGIVCDLIGRTIPRGQAGLVAGVIGATGCLAALVPPLVLSVVDQLDGSYEIGLVLLANVALATALHLRMRHELVDDALAYPVTPALPADLDATATTVVAVPAADAARSPAETAATLADLAAHHELVIVYGHDESAAFGPTALVEALRARLPRFRVTAVFLDAHPNLDGPDCALLAELLDEGALAVAVVPVTDPAPTARALAVRLAADTTLRLGYDPVDGTHLWTIAEPASPVPG